MSPVCLLCGEVGRLYYSDCQDWEYFLAAGSDFYRCTNCGFIFMNPLPTREELPRFYPSTYHNFTPPTNPVSRFLLNCYHARHVSICSRYLRSESSFLEIGSASGDLLERLRNRNYQNVQGVEISAEGYQRSREKDLKVFCGTLEEFSTDQQFDMIFMSHVIEHVLDPLAAIKRITQLLKPGGILYLETPNVGCLDAKIWGRDWGLVHYPRHLYLFSRSTFHRLIQTGGLEVEQLWFEINSCGWALSLQNTFRRLNIDQSRRARSFYYPFLLLACMPLNLLNYCFCDGTAFMTAICRKRY